MSKEKKKKMIDCPDCGGEGIIWIDEDQSQCETCGGEGEIESPE